MEKAAEGKDELVEKYLEEGELNDEEIVLGLRQEYLPEKFFR
jgi:elongation factor G